MIFATMTTNTTSLVITHITNLNFDTMEVVDNKLLEGMEVEPETLLPSFNTKKQIQEQVLINDIKDYHWLIKNGSMYKILNIID